MNKNKGFTLIELLVVIAIIGILASVVLASLNSARSKSANANIKSNLVNMRAQAAVVYDAGTSSYEEVCTDPNVLEAMNSMELAAGVVAGTSKCFADIENWVIASPLKVAEDASTHYCVDSTGKSIGVDATQFDAVIIDETNTILCP